MKTQDSILLFQFQGNSIRTAVHEGQNVFCAKDVCRALNIKWSGNKITLVAIPEQWRMSLEVQDSCGRQQESWFVSEPAVYKLAFRSNKAEAVAFTNWVAGTVLPALRKTGVFGMTQELAAQEVARAKRRMALIRELNLLEAEPVPGAEYVALLDFFVQRGTPLATPSEMAVAAHQVSSECHRTGLGPISRYLPGHRNLQRLWPRTALEAITQNRMAQLPLLSN